MGGSCRAGIYCTQVWEHANATELEWVDNVNHCSTVPPLWLFSRLTRFPSCCFSTLHFNHPVFLPNNNHWRVFGDYFSCLLLNHTVKCTIRILGKSQTFTAFFPPFSSEKITESQAGYQSRALAALWVLPRSRRVMLQTDVYFRNKRAFILPHKTSHFITLQTKNEETWNVM